MPLLSWVPHPSLFYLIAFYALIMTFGEGGLFVPHQAQAEEPRSLYERLGGYDAISEIIDEFLQKMFTDPQVGRYFVGMGTDTREQLRQKNKLLMCKNTGGPCKIINRDMERAHAGLKITNSDWKVTVTHLTTTLNTLKIGKQEQQELLHIIGSLQEKDCGEAWLIRYSPRT